jgi:hypothetical protein
VNRPEGVMLFPSALGENTGSSLDKSVSSLEL